MRTPITTIINTQINVSQLPAVNYLVRSVSVIYETDITEDNRPNNNRLYLLCLIRC